MIYNHLVRRTGQIGRPNGRLAATPDWNEVASVAVIAASDLSLPVNRAAALVGLWQSCPTCVPVASPTDATVSAPLVKPLMADIEARKDRACGCRPYAVTKEVLAAEQARWDAGSKELPFGWGWLAFDTSGNPLVIPSPPVQPSAAISSGGSDGSMTLLVLGALAVGTAAFVVGAGGKEQARDRAKALGAEGYAKSKELATRGYEAAKPRVQRAGRAALAKGRELGVRAAAGTRRAAQGMFSR